MEGGWGWWASLNGGWNGGWVGPVGQSEWGVEWRVGGARWASLNGGWVGLGAQSEWRVSGAGGWRVGAGAAGSC